MNPPGGGLIGVGAYGTAWYCGSIFSCSTGLPLPFVAPALRFLERLIQRNAINAISTSPTTPPTTPPAIAPALLLDFFAAGVADDVACPPLAVDDADLDRDVCVLWTCVAVDSGRLVSASAACGSKVPIAVTLSKAHPGTAVPAGMSCGKISTKTDVQAALQLAQEMMVAFWHALHPPIIEYMTVLHWHWFAMAAVGPM